MYMPCYKFVEFLYRATSFDLELSRVAFELGGVFINIFYNL